MLAYISSPISRPSLVLTINKISIGNPIELFYQNESIAGITFMDLIEYYGKEFFTASNLGQFAKGIRIEDLVIKESAYVLHISQCHIIEGFYQDYLKEEIHKLNLSVMKGIKSVAQLDLDIDETRIRSVW